MQKYGATSVADAARLLSVARRTVQTHERGHRVCAVVLARGDTTDELLRLALEVSPRPSRRELDVLLAAGERISCALLARAIELEDSPRGCRVTMAGSPGERHA